MITNLEELMATLRPFLPQYLEGHGRDCNNTHFQCPNAADAQAHPTGDKNPSANFNGGSEQFYCYSCGSGGDIFKACTLLEKRPSCGNEFVTENVLYLAEKYKVATSVTGKANDEKIKLFKILETLQIVFKKGLEHQPDESEIKTYIKSRGWADISEELGFGYCIDYKKIIDKLIDKGVDENFLLVQGLIHPSLFNNRLIFPIHNHYNKVIGFMSRSLESDCKHQKYIKSHKNLVSQYPYLYNLNRVKNFKSVYIVEGQANVFTLLKNNFKNVIALSGTNLQEEQYNLLVNCKVQELVLCLDNDVAGQSATEKILTWALKNRKNNINIKIKILLEHNDPDEYITKKSIKAFMEIPEITIFEYYINKYKITKANFDRDRILLTILAENSHFDREALIDEFSKQCKFGKRSVVHELNKLDQNSINSLIASTEDILSEQNLMDDEIKKFEKWAWTRGQLLGLEIGFPQLTKALDGLQEGFYLVAGDTNIGKTSFMLQMMFNLLKFNNPQPFILFFSIDDPLKKIFPRLLAHYSGLPINSVSKPKTSLTLDEQKIREQALIYLRNLSNRFVIKDVSYGDSIGYIKKMIMIYKKLAGNIPIIVFLDSFHEIVTDGPKDDKLKNISKQLKDLVAVYNIPIITTAEFRKSKDGQEMRTLEDIKDTIESAYRADVTFLLDNEVKRLKGKEKNISYYWTDSNGDIHPVIRVDVLKNKISSFDGFLLYKFYRDIVKIEELPKEDEMYWK